jgi:uncharacterized protein YgiM (DUF1202 family)
VNESDTANGNWVQGGIVSLGQNYRDRTLPELNQPDHPGYWIYVETMNNGDHQFHFLQQVQAGEVVNLKLVDNSGVWSILINGQSYGGITLNQTATTSAQAEVYNGPDGPMPIWHWQITNKGYDFKPAVQTPAAPASQLSKPTPARKPVRPIVRRKRPLHGAAIKTSVDAYDPNSTKDQWQPGETAHFEYHCLQSPESSDAEAWYRSHQPVTVLHEEDTDGRDFGGTLLERSEEGLPKSYKVRFPDGHEHSAFEDELLTDPKFFIAENGPGERPSDAAQSAQEPRREARSSQDGWQVASTPSTMYHYAPVHARADILQNGIDWRRSILTAHPQVNHPDAASSIVDWPEGNYLASPLGAQATGTDMWAVNTKGLNIERDPEGTETWFVSYDPIPSANVALHARGSEPCSCAHCTNECGCHERLSGYDDYKRWFPDQAHFGAATEWNTKPEDWGPIKIEQAESTPEFHMPLQVEQRFVDARECPECKNVLANRDGSGVSCTYCGWRPRPQAQ